ncbi:MAG: hypothetical protein ACRBDL_08240 [Alphaproteobacteria bacterium]
MVENNKNIAGTVTLDQFNTVVIPQLGHLNVMADGKNHAMDPENTDLVNITKSQNGMIEFQSGLKAEGGNGFPFDVREPGAFLEREGENGGMTYTKVPYFRAYAAEEDNKLLITYENPEGTYEDLQETDNIVFVKPVEGNMDSAFLEFCENRDCTLRSFDDDTYEIELMGQGVVPVNIERRSFSEMFKSEPMAELGDFEDPYVAP